MPFPGTVNDCENFVHVSTAILHHPDVFEKRKFNRPHEFLGFEKILVPESQSDVKAEGHPLLHNPTTFPETAVAPVARWRKSRARACGASCR